MDSRLLHLDGGDDPDSPETEVIGGKKKRGPRASTGEKNGKGLRHFSLRGQFNKKNNYFRVSSQSS
jgi:hypothetical protein